MISSFESILGQAAVEPWEHTRAAYQQAILQAMPPDQTPTCVVYPSTQEELAAAVGCAHRHGWRMLPCGNGTKMGWGAWAQGIDVVISTARLNQLIDHAVGDLTVTAAAGMPLATLQAHLQSNCQFLAVDPAFAESASLGGMIATADTGALRQRFGGIRDMLIGLSFVRFDGQVARAGGRVVKNVAGYDLMKLMTGAYGTLGILSQMTFRVYPMQTASQTQLLTGPCQEVVALMHALRRSELTPIALDVLSSPLMAQMGYGDYYGLAVRFQGIPEGVMAQGQRLQHLTQGRPELATYLLKGDADAAFWAKIPQSLWRETPEDEAVLGKLGLAPTAVESLLHLLTQLEQKAGIRGLIRIHGGSGLGTLRLEGGAVPKSWVIKLRSHCTHHHGFLTLLQAPLALKQSIDIWGYEGNALELMGRLKHQFDPDRCLSPGRFVGGI